MVSQQYKHERRYFNKTKQLFLLLNEVLMDIRKPHLILKLHLTAVTKITPLQNHDYNFSRRSNHKCRLHAGIYGMGVYAIMLPSSGFSVAHCRNHCLITGASLRGHKLLSANDIDHSS